MNDIINDHGMNISRRPLRSSRGSWAWLAILGCGLGGILGAASASATTWYVDGLNGKQSNSGTSAAPFLYFWQGNAAAKPGDTIYMQPTVLYPHMAVTTSGTSSQPITISGTGTAPNLTKVSGQGTDFGVWVNANYVNIAHLDVTAPGIHSGIYVTPGRHHVQMLYNNVHGAGEDGISTNGADYITIYGNTVYGNSNNTSEGVYASGISIKGSADIDSNTGLKMVVMNNIAYNNTNTPNCSTSSCYATATDSDGSGIILDDNRNTEGNNVPYNGRFFVANNVAFGNGGRGIHIYESDHITLDNNTLYRNNQDYFEGAYQPGEITGYYAGDIAVYNNILDSDGGTGENSGQHTGNRTAISFRYCTNNTGPIVISGNLGYRPQNDPANFLSSYNVTIPLSVSGTVWGDPQFENASLTASAADFRVKSASPAIGAGTSTSYASSDFLGVTRKPPITIGAYQNAGP